MSTAYFWRQRDRCFLVCILGHQANMQLHLPIPAALLLIRAIAHGGTGEASVLQGWLLLLSQLGTVMDVEKLWAHLHLGEHESIQLIWLTSRASYNSDVAFVKEEA